MTPTETTLLLLIDLDEASGPTIGIHSFTWLAEANSLETEWSHALDAWLAIQRSENTRRAYRAALNNFFDATGAAPWSASSNEVLAWIAAMRAAGRSKATIRQKLAARSSFYGFIS